MANDTDIAAQAPQQFQIRLVDLKTAATAPGQWGVVIMNGSPPTEILERLERNGWIPVFPPLPIAVEGKQMLGLYVRSQRQVVPVARFHPTPRGRA